MKKFLALVIAALLLIGSLGLLYTDLLYQLFDKDQVDDFITSVDQLVKEEKADESEIDPSAENTQSDAVQNENIAVSGAQEEVQGIERLGFDYIPLYTRTEQLCQKYVFKINSGDINSFGNIITDATNAYNGEGVTTEVYYLIIIALLSIPVYMLVRLLSFNTIYNMTNETNVLIRPFARGLSCLACSIVSITATWFVYRSTLYEFALSKLTKWIKTFDSSKIALNAVNIVIIVVLAIALIAILKKTMFRGSIILSVLLAVLRSVLFVIFFAFVNSFLSIDSLTWYVALFVLAALFIIGLVDLLIEPAKHGK